MTGTDVVTTTVPLLPSVTTMVLVSSLETEYEAPGVGVMQIVVRIVDPDVEIARVLVNVLTTTVVSAVGADIV
jgi:hypothetical protein